MRRRLRVGHKRPGRHGHEDRPAVGQPVDTIQVGNGPAGDGGGCALRLGRELERRHACRRSTRGPDKPLPSIPVGESANGVAVGDGSVWVTSEVSGTVTRVDPGAGAASSRSRPAAAPTPSRRAPARSGSPTVWTARSRASTRPPTCPAPTIPVGDDPNGIAVGGRCRVGEQRARRDPVEDRPRLRHARSARDDRKPPGGGRRRLRLAVRRRRRLGRRPPRRHADDADLERLPRPRRSGPRLRLARNQVAVLTNDGLTGFLRVGGSAGLQLVPDLAVSLPVPTDGGRLVQLPTAPGIHYSTGALVRPKDFRRAIERSLRLSRRAPSMPGTSPTSSAPEMPGRSERPCDLSQGIVTHAGVNTVTFHLTSPDPDFLYEARSPLGVRGARRHAAPSARIPARHRPVSDRVVRSEARHPARSQPAVSRVVGRSPAGWLPERDRRARPAARPTHTSPRF